MSRTCILQNSFTEHPRAFYWAHTHGLHVRFTGLSTPCTWISYLPSSVCRSRSYHLIKFITMNFRFSFRTYSKLTIITFHDFEQFTSSTTSKNCVIIAVAESCFNKTSSFPTTIFFFSFLLFTLPSQRIETFQPKLQTDLSPGWLKC